MSGRRCPLCGDLREGHGWCGSCRLSYRQSNVSHSNVMEVAEWGARRARAGEQRRARFERTLDTVVKTMRKGQDEPA